MSHAAERQPESDPATPPDIAWYQVTLSAIGDAVLTTDSQGRVTYMNPVAERLTGWVAAEAHGRPLEDVFRIVNEETRKPVEQPVRKVMETGLVRGMANHTILIARDGTEWPIDDSAAPVRDGAGNLTGIVMVFRDITDRREAERAAEDARHYAQSIVETVREPLIVLDSGRRVVSANRSFYAAFAVAGEQVEGCHFYELGDGQWNIPRLRTLLEEVLPAEDSFEGFEVDHAFAGNGHRRLLINGRRIRRRAGDDVLFLIAIEDITERWRVGVELHEQRERYRLIVESSTGYAIFTFDLDGVVTTWNLGAQRILGYSEAEMLGQNFRTIFTPEDVAVRKHETEMQRAAAEGQALDERWHVRKGGEQFWASGLVMPLRDEVGQTRGFLKILRDMTVQRQLEATLKERTAELERADVQKNQFLAMLAHELRNPLAAIRNAIAVAVRSGTVEDLEWSRDVVARQVRNFSHLIDDLLDVSRITEGKIQLRKELIDATPVIRHAIEAVKPLIEERKHEFQLSVTSADLRLEADPTRLEQILVNLLTNAAKYTPAGGRIQLIAGSEGEEIVFRVRDNGVGISPELLPRMFDLFVQADRSLGRSEGGLGIGLTLVRSLAELHGGTVTASSGGPDQGSEFVVRLPAVPQTAPVTTDSTNGPSDGEVRTKRMLVVDDNVDTANGMARLLKLSGHIVRVAHTGPTAIGAAREHRPELVLLDIGLPGMDGYEVAARLRDEDCCKDAVIIAVSGYGEEHARQRSEESGIDHHLVKPVNIDELFSLLRRS